MRVEFVKSCAGLGDRPPPGLPEILFLGRSNCGKSSLINLLLQRKGMAKTSGQPGKTQLLNYFRVEDRFLLVDLPGYGFAKVSKQRRARWWRLFEALLATDDRPLAVVHLVDVRHPPSTEDHEVADWIRRSGHPVALAVTKVDKVGRPEQPARFARIIADLELAPETPFVPTSSLKGLGRKELLGWIDELLAAAAAEDAGPA